MRKSILLILSTLSASDRSCKLGFKLRESGPEIGSACGGEGKNIWVCLLRSARKEGRLSAELKWGLRLLTKGDPREINLRNRGMRAE